MMEPTENSGTHGYLALVQLLASAVDDERLTSSTREAMTWLARFAGPDGTLCVSLSRAAESRGITRQAMQNALRPGERCGYLTSDRRQRVTGAEGAKVFKFNLDLAGANACPLRRWSDGLLELIAIALDDERLPAATRAAMTWLAGVSAPDGTLLVSPSLVAESRGTTAQAMLDDLRPAERFGYLVFKRRDRSKRQYGAAVCHFNLGIQDANSCREACRPEGVQPPEVAGGCNRQRLQGVQPPEVAHKKPLEETNIQRNQRGTAWALYSDKSRSGKTAGQQADHQRRAQQSLLLPIAGGARDSPPGEQLRTRVDLHNLDQRRSVSGRVMQEWFRLDGNQLLDFLGDGVEAVVERAITAEMKKRGNGCRYIAGAVERASKGRATTADIMARKHSEGPPPQPAMRMRS